MCDLNDGVPWKNVSQKRGFIVKWQRNIKFCLKMQIFLFPQIRLDRSVGQSTAPIPQDHGFYSPSSLFLRPSFFFLFLRPVQTRKFLKSPIFNPHPCRRSLKPIWRTVSKRCSFGERNHWFRMDGMPIRVKNMKFKNIWIRVDQARVCMLRT